MHFADTTTDPVEYWEGDELPKARKLSGLTTYGNITLKWGLPKRSYAAFRCQVG
jgi:hypothetical protein